MKDAASAVLAYVVAYELKFTVDTLNDWFSNVIKPKFFELDDIKKQVFLKENPIVNSKTVCSLFGFLLDAEDGWFDFVVKCEWWAPKKNGHWNWGKIHWYFMQIIWILSGVWSSAQWWWHFGWSL